MYEQRQKLEMHVCMYLKNKAFKFKYTLDKFYALFVCYRFSHSHKYKPFSIQDTHVLFQNIKSVEHIGMP